MALMPDRPSRSDRVTVSLSSPMQETMPVPVMTTRFLPALRLPRSPR